LQKGHIAYWYKVTPFHGDEENEEEEEEAEEEDEDEEFPLFTPSLTADILLCCKVQHPATRDTGRALRLFLINAMVVFRYSFT